MVEPTEISNFQELPARQRRRKAFILSERQNAEFEAYFADTEERQSDFMRRVVMGAIREHFASKEKEALKLEALRKLGGSSQ
jgi:hypothetical protein